MSAHDPPARVDDAPHIVEALIAERTEKLRRSRLWPLMRSLLYPLLRYDEAIRMADALAPLAARDVFDHMSRRLDLDIAVAGIENIPASGRIIIASTHPTGIADGIAMYGALKRVREDVVFFANRDALRVAPRLADMIVPVEWVVAKRTRERSRETLAATVSAFRDERCVVLFPSGRLAFMNEQKQLTEQPWQSSVAVFARKYDCTIVPARMIARNSRLYYWFWKLNTELRDMTLFNELLNKERSRYEIAFGKPIAPDALPDDPALAAATLRAHAAAGFEAPILPLELIAQTDRSAS